jgi:hypothetical protein
VKHVIVHDNYQINTVLENINELVDQGKSADVKIAEHRLKRSLPSNRLYWMWLDQIAKSITKRFGSVLQVFQMEEDGTIDFVALPTPQEVDKDYMHRVFKTMFLPWLPGFSMGQVEVLPERKSTRDLTSSEFNHYLTKIHAWAVERGIELRIPQSEYQEFLAEQDD